MSNEGIKHTSFPFFSVQFHPESHAGPWDTEYLFDEFVEAIKKSASEGKLSPLPIPQLQLPIRHEVSKVLILGSGGLSIGQAGEFDYSGSQAIKALKEEGIYTVLMNPNIATIQTSKGMADKVYFLPVTPDYVRKVIEYEKPDGIYVTFGGQTALNVGVAMRDEFDKLGVKILGTPIETIMWTEDRDLFAKKMLEIGEKCAPSRTANNIKEALAAVSAIGYPVIIRAAYALGGLGSGFANNQEEFVELCQKAFASVPQVLVEKSLKGWKEVEYEVVRDCIDNCITVCNMENFDPLGIHTGDSIVIAPSQTLSDHDYNLLRNTAIKVIRHLKVVGECNIQYALDPNSDEYFIIEVNARLSRSSALASKATGYPLAFVAAKLGLGIPLTDIQNNVTQSTVACFEPSLDYVVVKIPRWDLKKFSRVRTKIGSAMKSVGEVMSIGRNLEEAFQKALQSVDGSFSGFCKNDLLGASDESLSDPTDLRVFAIANALHDGYSVERIAELTHIDKWFLHKLNNIILLEKQLASSTPNSLTEDIMRKAKSYGFSDKQLAKLTNTTELVIRKHRKDWGILPVVKQIDTVSAEFPASTNYLYMTYNGTENDVSFTDRGIMVLGSGVYRIGSSVEFDWCAVGAIRTLRNLGHKTIMVNYNPETVSTDYDEADRLYFENITLERILDIYELESASGTILSMGGQTANNIALSLYRQGVKVLGTSPQMIDMAENRYKFSRLLDDIDVDQPRWKELTNTEEAAAFCDLVEYPVLVRPSYVLSGAAMNVVFSPNDLDAYLGQATAVSREFPVVISKFIEEAKEIEVDAVAKEGELVMHVITEHVENAGVHSGDATLILPPQDLDKETIDKVTVATAKIASALNVTGPFNIQFIAKNKEIKVIECNVRASRSFPFVSKVTDVDLIEMAVKAMINYPFQPYPESMRTDRIGVKVAQFSFSRLMGADPILGVEMASTGEVACFGKTKHEAYLKALVSTGFRLPKKNVLVSIGSYKEKLEFLPSVKRLHELGFVIFATTGTADFYQEHNIPVKVLESLDHAHGAQRAEYSLSEHLANNLIDLYVNLPSKNKFRRPASYMSSGYRSRRMAVDFSIPLITNIKCAKLFVEALAIRDHISVSGLDYKSTHENIVLPGLVGFQPLLVRGAIQKGTFNTISKTMIATGMTVFNVSTLSLAFDDFSTPQNTKIFCDYFTSQEVSTLGDGKIMTPTVYLRADEKFSTGDVSKLLKDWKSPLPVIVSASGSSLASVLLLASLHKSPVHILNVRTKDDIELIAVAKEKGISVTCDVNPKSLFPLPDMASAFVSGETANQRALWENLSLIDCFSLIEESDTENVLNASNTLSLLFEAYQRGLLSVDDISRRLYNNPRTIFELPEQPDTYVVFEMKSSGLKNLRKGMSSIGRVNRVVIRGKTVFLDGVFFEEESEGQNLTSTIKMIVSSSSSGKEDVSVQKKLPQAIPSSRRGSLKQQSNLVSISRAELLADNTHVNSTAFKGRNVLTVSTFSRNDLHVLFGVAHMCRNAIEKQKRLDIMRGKVLCTAFFEPSTRTCLSFETAMQRLGGSVVSVNSITSSVAKGESIADTG
jgi:carbamoyl-phosphate synthase/aspartate carbamoyltransferase